jgi:hypothetical protein
MSCSDADDAWVYMVYEQERGTQQRRYADQGQGCRQHGEAGSYCYFMALYNGCTLYIHSPGTIYCIMYHVCAELFMYLVLRTVW